MAVTLDAAEIERIADAHETARRTTSPIRRVTLEHPDMTIEDAYAVQRAWVARQVADGARVIGHKVGLTSRAMQQAMHIDEPDFGVLLDHMQIPDGGTIRAADHLDPKLEVELAFVLGGGLGGPDVTAADVLAATAYVSPALELIDARSHRRDPVDGVTRTVRDTIADNAANSGVVLGTERVDPTAVDLRWVPAVLSRNGVVEETGVAAGVLNNPVNGIVWLTRKFAPFDTALEPGQVVLAGSFTRPVPVAPGDTIHGDYGHLGSITCRFR